MRGVGQIAKIAFCLPPSLTSRVKECHGHQPTLNLGIVLSFSFTVPCWECIWDFRGHLDCWIHMGISVELVGKGCNQQNSTSAKWQTGYRDHSAPSEISCLPQETEGHYEKRDAPALGHDRTLFPPLRHRAKLSCYTANLALGHGLKKPGLAKAPDDSCSSYSGMLMSAANGNREVKQRAFKKMASLAFLKRCSPGPVLLWTSGLNVSLSLQLLWWSWKGFPNSCTCQFFTVHMSSYVWKSICQPLIYSMLLLWIHEVSLQLNFPVNDMTY